MPAQWAGIFYLGKRILILSLLLLTAAKEEWKFPSIKFIKIHFVSFSALTRLRLHPEYFVLIKGVPENVSLNSSSVNERSSS